MREKVCATVTLLALWGLALLLGWPWWVDLFLALLVTALLTGIVFATRLLLRRRERQSVQQVMEQDDQGMQSLAAGEQERNRELQRRWKEAVEALRRSQLRKQGNPLYVLPWYLMLGESGSGKSTALGSARLATPFSDTPRASEIAGTGSCEWWFFDHSVVVDTAGRYAIQTEESDRDEWQRFLSLLVKYRKKEPLHGVVLTVAADRLLESTPEALEQHGLQLRRRLEELMRVMAVSFPVYLLVTRCDLVQGMTLFTARLGEDASNQPMGVVNHDLSREVTGFVAAVMHTVGERLKDLRIRMLQNQGDALDAAALLFPDEFLKLRRGLEVVAKAAFQENRYQESPVLRGIYFGSGRRDGIPASHPTSRLGAAGERGSGQGLFLHDFFDKVLPGDRTLLAPTTRAVQWQSLTRNLGLTAWVALWVGLCGLMSFVFVKNIATIRGASAAVAQAPRVRGAFLSDMATMEQHRRMILAVEQKNRNWRVPRFWLNESLAVEGRLKERYCREFQERFLAPFDRNMSETISGFSAATSDQAAGDSLVHLARRINLLKLRVEQENAEALTAKPLPSYLLGSGAGLQETEQARKFGELYLGYLLWRGDRSEIKTEIELLQGLLKRVVSVKGTNLRWLPEWANRQGLPPITLQTFWGGSRACSQESCIAPAFTRKGWETVTAFRRELASAYPEQGVWEREEGDFLTWYRGNCYAAWLRFAASFPKGEERLNGPREWRAVAEQMATDQGPYFAFFDRVVTELPAFGKIESLPPLLQQIVQFRLLKNSGAAALAASRAVEEGKKLTAKVGDLLGKPVREGSAAGSQAAAAKACSEYCSALCQIAPALRSRGQAYQMALQAFTEEPTAGKSPFHLAENASQRLRSEMGGGRDDELFARLAGGPHLFLWSYVQKEAACAIQSRWEEQVLKEAQGARDPQMMQYLVAQEGPVWKFVNGTLAPFQGWSPARGYYSKGALGGSIPFQPALFSFLAKGTKAKVALARAPVRQSHPVTVKGLPTDANAEARVKPQSTRLELQCASGAQVMENLNFPVSRTFTWAADSCGEVTFQIEIGEFLLARQYQGFPAFLKEFQGGRRTFYPNDFPKEKGALERMGIRFIRANYQFSGAAEVLKQGGGAAASDLGDIPRYITKCWD